MPEFVHYPPNATVISVGDEADRYFIINHGEVEVYLHPADSERTQLRVLRNGDHFGEIGLLRNIRRTANVRTITHCDLLIFTSEEFQEMVTHNPQLRTSFEHEADFLLRPREEEGV